MNRTEAKRQEITEKIADYLLAEGLQKASLRPMAAAIGTSDRMLLHYFSDKEELLSASLLHVTDRLVSLLDQARPDNMPLNVLLPRLIGLLKAPHIRPFLKLWLELAAQSQVERSYSAIARQLGDVFLNWIETAIKVDQESSRRPVASLIFATIEGVVLLDAIGYDAVIEEAVKGIEIAYKG